MHAKKTVIKKVLSVFLILTVLATTVSILTPSNKTSSSTKRPMTNGIDFSKLTMACLGDSLTMQNVDEEGTEPYPTILKKRLGLSQVYNYGMGWSTVGYMENCSCHTDTDYNHNPFVYRYDTMVEADIIAVQGGINDKGVDLPIGDIEDTEATTFYGALNILASGLKEKYPNSYIFFMTGFNYYTTSTADWEEYTAYNNAIEEVCEKHGIDCLDIYNAIAFNRSEYTTDNIHPTNYFVENIWVPVIASFVRNNYK